MSESRDDSFNPRANTDFTLEGIGIRGFNVLTDGNRPLTQREVGIPSMNISGFLGLAERDGGVHGRSTHWLPSVRNVPVPAVIDARRAANASPERPSSGRATVTVAEEAP